MREEVASLLIEKDNILNPLSEYESKIRELIEKIEDGENSETVREELEITYKLKTKSKTCWYFSKGYCKKGFGCKYNHGTEYCVRHLERARYEVISCNLRHRKDCIYWKKGFCF